MIDILQSLLLARYLFQKVLQGFIKMFTTLKKRHICINFHTPLLCEYLVLVKISSRWRKYFFFLFWPYVAFMFVSYTNSTSVQPCLVCLFVFFVCHCLHNVCLSLVEWNLEVKVSFKSRRFNTLIIYLLYLLPRPIFAFTFYLCINLLDG